MNYRFLLAAWYLWFLVFGTRASVSPVLPAVEDEFHLSHGAAGSLVMVMGIGNVGMFLAAGLVASLLGYRRVLVLSVTLAAGFLTLVSLAPSFWAMAGALFLVGASAGAFLPSMLSILTAGVPPHRWGTAIGLFDTAASLSVVAIPMLASVLLPVTTWRWLFRIMTGALVVGLGPFLLTAPPVQGRPALPRGSLRRTFGSRSLLILILLWVLCTANSMALYSIMPLYLVKARGMEIALANSIVGLTRLPSVLAPILTGWLLDRFGGRAVLGGVTAVAGGASCAIALFRSFPLLVAAMVVNAVAANGFFAAGLAYIARLVGPREQAATTGYVGATGILLGFSLMPPLLGVVADRLSFEAGIIMAGGVTVLLSPLSRWLDEGSGTAG
ncbi:MAG: MFS transporter [Deltaproteobacteria bacterium]|nr:MFS transporter [Deltaproteobacteria bacterium]